MNEDTKKSFAAILAAAQAKANVKSTTNFVSKPIAEKMPVNEAINQKEGAKVEIDTTVHDMPEMSTMTFADLVNDTHKETTVKHKVEIKDYSDKSFAVIGETYPLRYDLSKFGGKFNYNLKCGPGWIFSKTKYDTVKKYLEIAA